MSRIPTNVDEIIDYVIRVDEGGWKFTNDPNDPGGATYAGVTYKKYTEWREKNNKSLLSQSAFMIEAQENRRDLQIEIIRIYEEEFYKPLHLDRLPDYIRCMLFSAAVNVGTQNAGEMLQEVINQEMPGAINVNRLEVDGIVGPQTIEAAVLYLTFNMELIRLRVKHRLFYQWMKYYNGLVAANAKAWVDYSNYLKAGNTLGFLKPRTLRAIYLNGWFNRAYRYIEVE